MKVVNLYYTKIYDIKNLQSFKVPHTTRFTDEERKTY